ncbi:hypothetical protein JR334_02065 [Clostridia bacterium]|nr:hypothetical protein JR334_02065 [Clostridia bacterium]
MPLAWDGFINDARTGDLAGLVHYYDNAAQLIIIRDSDNALISTYGKIEEGDWLEKTWENNSRMGNFGLTDFVLQHNFNGEVWAAGITPIAVAAGEGRYPTPAVSAGLYLYRYAYYKELTDALQSLDTSESGESSIKDASLTIANPGEDAVNKDSSIYAPGSRIVGKIGVGDADIIPVCTVYVDNATWSKTGDSLQLQGRNAIGYLLKEQTFDEDVSYSGTRISVLTDILTDAGIDMTKVFIDPTGSTASSVVFEPSQKISEGLANILHEYWYWDMMETPAGDLVFGGADYLSTFTPLAIHEFKKDDVFTRSITQKADGAYSRLALESKQADDSIVRVYKDVPNFDGWNLGSKKTLYITTVEGLDATELGLLGDEYVTAYQYIGVNLQVEVPIRPEIQSGDVFEVTDAEDYEYLSQAVVTSVNHIIDALGGSAKTLLSVDSGGDIENDGGTITTLTAKEISGDNRKQELYDIIAKAVAGK